MTTPIEETWWKVTTSAGLVLTLPAPLSSTGGLKDPAQSLDLQVPVASSSALTGKSYAMSLRGVIHIEVFTLNPERYRQALEKMVLRRSSKPSSGDSQEPESPSGGQGSPSGRSTGATIRRRTH